MEGVLIIGLWLFAAFGIGFMYWLERRETHKIVKNAINRGFNR